MCNNMEVFHVRYLLIKRCQLVEMGRKQAEGVNLRRYVSRRNINMGRSWEISFQLLRDSPGEPKAVVRRCSSS